MRLPSEWLLNPPARRFPKMRRLIVAAVIALTGSVGAGAQQGQEGPLATFSSQAQLVEVYATVTDQNGELVTGLKRSDFQVYENNRMQAIDQFAFGEFPLTVALGVDRSWSMAGKPLELAKQASKSFLNQLKTGDRSMVVAISSTADVVAPLSADRFNQARLITALDPWSTTALRDAIIASLDRLEAEPGRQALVLFSDGNDRYSAAGESEVIARARRSNALIYPITIGKQRPSFLPELAVLTGGRSFVLKDAIELERTLSTIARELRYQYLLGYAPSDQIVPGTHEWRSIRVALSANHAGLRVRARDGYTTD
jgi:Ca-activated chloride channel family protein